MEEIYIIKLKDLTLRSSSETPNGDWIGEATLGLSILHVTLGILGIILGILGLLVEYDSNHMGAGIWCGLMFELTGVSGIFVWKFQQQRSKMRIFLGLSSVSVFASILFLVLSCFGVANFHATPRNFNQMARVGGNAIITAFLELTISILSVVLASSAIYPSGHCSLYTCKNRKKKKVIIATNVYGGVEASKWIQQISPNCIIYFSQNDRNLEANRRVGEYVRETQQMIENHDEYSFSEESAVPAELDASIDSEHWRNDVMEISRVTDNFTSYIRNEINE
ncbi:uncharacterized protein LOC143231850 [Tachypleus tridentatus]|uniref:uncharacterized protein LOC143231850 n=1 Tax=Tachypleus tridentatus TaxID=6853 RepID=UPI003FD2DAE3